MIRWSQPEIALYDDDPIIRMSYPDLVEDGGEYYLTETQKDVARVHKIDKFLIEGLWAQVGAKSISTSGLILNLASPKAVDAPLLPVFLRRSRRAEHGSEHLGRGVSIDLWIALRELTIGQILVDNRTPDGKGFALTTAANGAVEIVLNDGRTENRWQSDLAVLTTNQRHHLVVIVDAGPNIITFVVDGKLSDGGESRQFGFGRFSPNLYSLNGASTLRAIDQVLHLRLYDRALRTSEAIAAFRAGL